MPWKEKRSCSGSLPAALPRLADRGGQGVGVGRLVAIAVDGAQLRNPAPGHQLGGQGVEGGRGGGRRVLRVEREEEDAAAAGVAQLGEGGGDRRPPVAHAERDVHRRPADPFGQHAAQRVALAPRDDQQRRALVGPHRRVELRRLARPEGEDEQVEDQPPQQPRQLDHPRVGQELPQVGPQRLGGRRLRRPQVGQQHPHRRHLAVLEPALSDVLHGPAQPLKYSGNRFGSPSCIRA